MAAFHIHQDAEKENPRDLTVLKEKKSIVSVGGSNFAVFNDKTNNGQARIDLGGSTKMAFRDVGNVDSKCDGSLFASSVDIAKKTVVEQFKTFSVYEDQQEVESQRQRHQFVSIHTSNSSGGDPNNPHDTQIEKENIFGSTQRHVRDQIGIKVLAETEAGKIDHNIFDASSMSVSEVFTPMSVDRSHITSQIINEDADCNNYVNVDENDPVCKQTIPRNDRQRFYEVIDYQRNILEYFRESEQKYRPKPNYMRRQGDINYSMRTILVDWLVEVSEEYNLDTETLYLSVMYIDRFLSHMSVVRSKLQLVGTAAMYIASKYEEIYPPDVGEFVFITDDTYSKAQVLRMEQIILKILSFCLCTPTAYAFINTYAVIVDMADKLKYLTLYICELSLLEADPYLRFCPSLVSAGSHALARHILDYTIWSPELEDITSYRLEDLKEVVQCLSKSHIAATTLPQQAIQEKYTADKYLKVSKIKPVEIDNRTFQELLYKFNDLIANKGTNKEQNMTAAETNNDNVQHTMALMFK